MIIIKRDCFHNGKELKTTEDSDSQRTRKPINKLKHLIQTSLPIFARCNR